MQTGPQKKICRRLSETYGKEIIEEYGTATGQFLQMKHEEGAMPATASSCRDARIKQTLNQKYGQGAAEFFALAIEAIYKAE